MPKPLIRLGLIGLNNQGKEHLQGALLSKRVQIVALCDRDPETLEKGCAILGDVATYTSHSEFLAHPQLEGIILALPHQVYEDIWDDVVAVGVPLLKEKPLGRTLSEAQSFLSRARANAVPIVTAIQRRMHPTYVNLKECLEGQTINAVTAMLHLGFDPAKKPDNWRGDPVRAGGGALLDSGYHMIDLVHYLIGSFEVIHANLWVHEAPALSTMLETDATLMGRVGSTWVRVESRVGGRPDPDRKGKFLKQERVEVETCRGIYTASRDAISLNGEEIWTSDRSWDQSMCLQLDHFEDRIQEDSFDDADVWDQVPVMRVIEQAYGFAQQVGPIPRPVGGST